MSCLSTQITRLPSGCDLRSNRIGEMGLRALLLAASASPTLSNPLLMSDAALLRALGPLGLRRPLDGASLALEGNPCAKLGLFEDVYHVGPSVLGHLS